MSENCNNPGALVTGGATRLGLAFARSIAQRGYDIALHCHSSTDVAHDACKEIRELGVRCEVFQADFSCDRPDDLIHQVAGNFPNLQLLVNSASAYEAASIANTSLDLLRQQFSVNFFAPFMLTQAFAKSREIGTTVKANVGTEGSRTKGTVINILDNKIAFQQNDYAAYLLSKKTLAEFTRLAAIEYAPSIRINGIAPGVVLPGDERTEDYVSWRVENIPLKQQGKVDDLLRAINYLMDSEFVTGQIITVDGGENINHQGHHAESFNRQSNE